MIRTIKNALIKLWVWLTPQAVKNRITSEFLREMVKRPKLASNLTQPLVRRVSYPDAISKMIQVEPLPEGARPIYDREPIAEDTDPS